jgi:hypothetical protein
MPERMSEDMPGRMPEGMSEDMPDKTASSRFKWALPNLNQEEEEEEESCPLLLFPAGKICQKDVRERMSEYMSETGMTGITRTKVFLEAPNQQFQVV